MGDHWSDASGETNSQGVTGGVYRARHVCGPAHKGHADLTSSPPSSSISLAVPRECGMHLLVSFGAVLAGRTKPTTYHTTGRLA
ncbi:hypothetical protein Lal_00042286 [Lupinus albus]|nr:hypothetical protein Lal_00042286 [Lupinus albus]